MTELGSSGVFNRFLAFIQSKSNIIIASLAMGCAIMAGASIGPIFKYMQANSVPAILAASWRCQCMCIFLIPAAIIERFAKKSLPNRIDWFAKYPDLTFKLYVHIFIAGLAWTANLLLWVIALRYVTTVQASILTSTHPVMLVIYYLTTKTVNVSTMEVAGVVVVFLGVVFASFHTSIQGALGLGYTSSSPSEGTNSTLTQPISSDPPVTLWGEVIGTALCLLSSTGEVVVLLNRAKIKVS
jgi:drug/metabolite transporter (DMT)-like permease